jgi:hypothetical protein
MDRDASRSITEDFRVKIFLQYASNERMSWLPVIGLNDPLTDGGPPSVKRHGRCAHTNSSGCARAYSVMRSSQCLLV